MFGLFKKKTKAEKLQEQYEKLMQRAFELSTINRASADKMYAEADKILKQLQNLE